MTFNVTGDPWVAYLQEDGTTQSCLMSATLCIRSLWATLAMVFNAAIVYVTLKTTSTVLSLHGICNILIATESFWAMLMDAGFHISTVLFVSGVKFITYRTCFPMLFCICLLPGNLAQIAMVLTGFDRLLSIVFPIWYKTRTRWQCFFVTGIVQAIYGLHSIVSYTYDFILSNQMTLVGCSSDDKFLGGTGEVNKNIGLTLSGTLMVMYSLIFLFAFMIRPIVRTINDSSKRLIKSLVFIIGMQLFGVIFRVLMKQMFATYYKMDVFFNTTFSIGMSFITIAVYSANAPVLYVFSEEYRKCFNKHFPWLQKVFKWLNADPAQRRFAATATTQLQQQNMSAAVNNNNNSSLLTITMQQLKNNETQQRGTCN